MRSIHAFTLIEMLVVIGIMMLFSGMVMIAYEGSDTDAVTVDALELQTVLQRARSLTLSSGRSHAVTFHIENAGDGSVFKNYSENDALKAGRHWYAIIGPDNSDVADSGAVRSSKRPPTVRTNGSNGASGYNLYTFFTLADYAETVESLQVGPRHYLSEGVRFLALTDSDSLYYQEADATYPRPWFGYYDPAAKTLYPWGGYNRDIDAGFGEPNTGLDYEGVDGPIPYNAPLDTNVHPEEVWGRIHYTRNFITDSGTGATAKYPAQIGTDDNGVYGHFNKKEDYQGPDKTVLPGRPRAVVNGYWSDFMILFNPNGSSSIVRSHSRGVYLNESFYGRYGDKPRGRAHMEMDSSVDQSGGYAVTLCRDVDVNDVDLYKSPSALTGQAAFQKFETVEDAYRSITPFLRVFVNRLTGIAEVQNNEHPNLRITSDDLLQHDPYPRGFN